MIKLFFIIMTISFVISCQTQFGLIHSIETPDGSNRAILNSDMVTVIVEPFTEDTWKRIAANHRFIDSSKGGRLPKIPLFMIIIDNKSTHPVTLTRVELRYDTNSFAMLTKQQLQSLLSSPAYSFINIDQLLTPHRLLPYGGDSTSIDFARDAIACTFLFIPPGDTFVYIAAFQWIPVEIKTFAIEIYLSTPQAEKKLDCNFVRREYRSKGKYFLKEKQQ